MRKFILYRPVGVQAGRQLRLVIWPSIFDSVQEGLQDRVVRSGILQVKYFLRLEVDVVDGVEAEQMLFVWPLQQEHRHVTA